MTNIPMDFIFTCDVFGIVFNFSFGPTWVELMDFDSDFTEVCEVVGSPYFGKTAFAELIEGDVSVIELCV